MRRLLEFDYVVIGNGAAGVGAVEGIRRLDPKGTIAVIGDELVMPYSRCFLTGYISGRYTAKNLSYRPSAFYERNKVDLHLGRKAVSLSPQGSAVLLDDGSRLGCKKILLATGASAVMPELRGKALPGVHTLRTIEDAEAISSDASSARTAVVMGGGLVGVGLAIALHERGLKVHLVVASHQLLSQNLDRMAADLLAAHLRRKGIDVQLNQDVVEVLGPHRATGARLADGRVLECELVASAKGVRMNTDLAASAGLQVRRGVVVDDRMRTSAPGIYAAGDVAEARSFVSAKNATMTLWPIASEQGRVAGTNMAGGDVEYQGGLQIVAVDYLGMHIASIGESRDTKESEGARAQVQYDPEEGYRRVIFMGDEVVGATLAGEWEKAGALMAIPCTRIDVRKARQILFKERFAAEDLVDALMERKAASGPGR